ncbi:predicted protein [Lichtheimia corymbifera JMRC:FSU:9682]|uniref:Ras modification protein ERF4 n=1 Tax=Lichtheimia corymbifera JMRC:FSU:9682 TaxID=1263082 RepID=A0A068SDW0_9FUNG|nr:predicted protein [Lichtheimia corymbifera JMRC:FSU:9682]
MAASSLPSSSYPSTSSSKTIYDNFSSTTAMAFAWQHKRQQHRYTDTCLFYPPAFSSRHRHGYVRRYSTTSIDSGMTTTTTRSGHSSLHRKAMSLDTLPVLLQQQQKDGFNPFISRRQEEQHDVSSNNNNMPSSHSSFSLATHKNTASGINDIGQQNAMATRSHPIPPPLQQQQQQQQQPPLSPPPPTARMSEDYSRRTSRQSIHATMIDMARPWPTRTIRIERDYSRGDGVTRFSTEFPIELHGKITANQFQHTMDTINTIMDRAEKVSLNVFDNIMECLTIYIWPMLVTTHYQKCIKQLANFIDSENELLYHAKGLSISDPVRCAFLFLEIRIYD